MRRNHVIIITRVSAAFGRQNPRLDGREITSPEDDQNKQKVFGSIDGDEFSLIFIDSDRIHRWSH